MDTQTKPPATARRESNAELLSALLERDEGRLRSQARRHAELPEDAEDALQSAYPMFIKRFRGDCEPLAWLYTTVKREAWRIRRRASRRRELSLDRPLGAEDSGQSWVEAMPSNVPGPAELALRGEDLGERQEMLAELKPDQRRALGLLAAGFSYREICQITGWTHTKVNRSVAEGRVGASWLSRDRWGVDRRPNRSSSHEALRRGSERLR
ncbi:MAG: sigma-70 family RNA polymerase sigma factor [Solirubrobacterales bacterium]